MAVYANAASNRSQPLNLDYVDAANMVNVMCGPTFVNASIPDAGSGSAGGMKKSAAARGGGAGWMMGVLVGGAVLLGAL